VKKAKKGPKIEKKNREKEGQKKENRVKFIRGLKAYIAVFTPVCMGRGMHNSPIGRAAEDEVRIIGWV
jgi:hypothetical protein